MLYVCEICSISATAVVVPSVGCYSPPSFFLCSRWIRLLFSREFPFLTTLDLWDAIFAEGNTLEIVDYLYVAMLVNIRGQREWGCVVMAANVCNHNYVPTFVCNTE